MIVDDANHGVNQRRKKTRQHERSGSAAREISVGRPTAVYHCAHRPGFLFLVVPVGRMNSMKKHIVLFVLAFLVCGALFLTLDIAIMTLMG